MEQEEAGLYSVLPHNGTGMHRKVYSNRRFWRGLALHIHTDNSTKGRAGSMGVTASRMVGVSFQL